MNIMKRLCVSLLLGTLMCTAFAEPVVRNYPFVQRDTLVLSMDVYTSEHLDEPLPCVLFVFGGGFVFGSKDAAHNVDFCRALCDSGYIVAAIDYRLGLKNVKKVGALHVQPLENAINMAVEDLYAATSYILDHADTLQVDTSLIMVCGSSAGAITALQADYELCNRTALAESLPDSFQYAGVIAFAGAVFSREGKPDYRLHKPAPTLMFHGQEDRIVIYDRIRLFNLGFFGSSELAKRFEKYGTPYAIYRYRGLGHEVASYPMQYSLPEINRFINEYVLQQLPMKTDATVYDSRWKADPRGSMRAQDMYRNQ